LSVSLGLLSGGTGWLPDASTFAPRVNSVFEGLLVASVGMLVLLGSLTAAILIRYRRGSSANRATVRTATWKIEAAWTAGTTAVFLFFFWRGAAIYLDMRRIPMGGDEIDVIGRQWMWDVRYDDGRREFNELHVRVNQPVRLVLSSEDVIHSFFVPAFRLKQDLVPGKIVSAWFNPTKAGVYTLFCAQYCGTAHAEMTGRVVVLEPDQYSAWKAGNATGEGAGLTSAGRGRALYVKYGCAVCHDDPSGSRAPALAGTYGNLVRLIDGRFVRADEQFLHDAILLAPKYVVAGYVLRMPTYDGLVTETNVVDLVSYVKSLRNPPPSSTP